MAKGDKLFVEMAGKTSWFLGEVIQEDPLVIKIAENGPLARIKVGDFTILERETAILRENGDDLQKILHEQYMSGRPVQTGLLSYGSVKKGKLHSVLSRVDENQVRSLHYKFMAAASLRGSSRRRRR